jgi:hypothetical protein
MLVLQAHVLAGVVMFTGCHSRIVARFVSAIVLSFGLVSAGIGQTSAEDEESTPEDVGAAFGKVAREITPEADKTLDEIIVYGQQNVIVLRNELNRAQESFFAMYSTLNSDDDFDVSCKKRQASISQRSRKHRCTPRFANRYAAQAAGSFLSSGSGGLRSSDFANLEYQVRIKAKEKEMWAEIVELAKSNAQFREEIRGLMEAGRALNEEKERRGPCPKIFCRD